MSSSWGRHAWEDHDPSPAGGSGPTCSKNKMRTVEAISPHFCGGLAVTGPLLGAPWAGFAFLYKCRVLGPATWP